MKKLKHKSGQALVESLLSMPLLVAGVTLVLAGLHSLSLFYIVDHWTYNTAVCLVQENSPQGCREQLSKRLQQLPLQTTRIKEVSATSKEVSVQIQLHTPFIGPLLFVEKIPFNLTSFDLEEAYE